jgi:DNA invertase Pin-like site-specific DNA recombinase
VSPEQRSRKAALYARVSTSAQDYEPQLAELKKYIGLRGWILEGEYVDVASGVDAARPNLARLFRNAWDHRFDVVVVSRYDRFSRSLRHLLESVDLFREKQIDFVSLHEQVDTSTAAGKLYFCILGGFAEFERTLRAERSKAGQDLARAKGKHMGRPPRRVDAKKICEDYAVLRSSAKVARLHRCSQWLVLQIVKEKRQLSETARRMLADSRLV